MKVKKLNWRIYVEALETTTSKIHLALVWNGVIR